MASTTPPTASDTTSQPIAMTDLVAFQRPEHAINLEIYEEWKSTRPTAPSERFPLSQEEIARGLNDALFKGTPWAVSALAKSWRCAKPGHNPMPAVPILAPTSSNEDPEETETDPSQASGTLPDRNEPVTPIDPPPPIVRPIASEDPPSIIPTRRKVNKTASIDHLQPGHHLGGRYGRRTFITKDTDAKCFPEACPVNLDKEDQQHWKNFRSMLLQDSNRSRHEQVASPRQRRSRLRMALRALSAVSDGRRQKVSFTKMGHIKDHNYGKPQDKGVSLQMIWPLEQVM